MLLLRRWRLSLSHAASPPLSLCRSPLAFPSRLPDPLPSPPRSVVIAAASASSAGEPMRRVMHCRALGQKASTTAALARPTQPSASSTMLHRSPHPWRRTCVAHHPPPRATGLEGLCDSTLMPPTQPPVVEVRLAIGFSDDDTSVIASMEEKNSAFMDLNSATPIG
jgi:hypothetical protein